MPQTLELKQDHASKGVPPSGDLGAFSRTDPLIGRSLLHYRVLEVIGQGGMSVVYRGRDERLQRDVAIKVLHPFLAEKPECRARLVREARAVARLEHPHILKVFDFSGEPASVPPEPLREQVPGLGEGFIVAELVRGPTLRRFAEDHELWRSPEVAAMVVWQLARALQHAHDNGVIHRDLKPENIMVREDGCLKLMDFGIAHVADQKGLTITGTLLGSPAHMAPECIDGHEASARSDVFSLGTVLYWLATGALPFEAHTPHALLKQIVEGKAVPAQQRSPRISDELAKVIGRAMATRPEERFEDAAALAAALADVLSRADLAADAEQLLRILAAPAEQLPRAAQVVRAAFLRRAEEQLFAGAAARALSSLNRVLAENRNDEDAQALLARLHADVDARADEAPATPSTPSTLGEPAAEGAALSGIPALVQASATLTSEAVRPTTSTPPATEPGRLARQLALVAVAAGLIAAAVAVSTSFDAERAPATAGAGPSSTPAVEPPSVAADAPPKAKPPTPTVRRSAPVDASEPGVQVERSDRRPEREAAPPLARAVEGARAPAALPSTRLVTLRVKPWAEMFVDGKLVATGKRAEVELPVGAHTIAFRNVGARDADVRVEVPAEGPVPEVAVELEPRPAYLTVRSNMADAFVSVNGQGGKLAGETLSAPLLVPLGKESVARLEVIVHKKGYAAFVRRVDFVAGRTLQLDVVLGPEGPRAAAPGADATPGAGGGVSAPAP